MFIDTIPLVPPRHIFPWSIFGHCWWENEEHLLSGWGNILTQGSVIIPSNYLLKFNWLVKADPVVNAILMNQYLFFGK